MNRRGTAWVVGAMTGWALACSAAGLPDKAPPPPPEHRLKDPRLSWAPIEYLRQGFRNAPWINDPFFPQANILHLSGLISGEMAFINGKWFRLGEKVDGYDIVSIKGSGVTLKRRGQILQLKMEPTP